MDLDFNKSLESLVLDFAPILHFHENEGDFCCYPSDAEQIYSKYNTDWSQFRKSLTPTTLNPSAPCYYETWKDEDLIQIRYWFWYNYNKFPGAPFGLGNHLGDWEHVEIRFFPKISDGPCIIWFVSNHKSSRITSFPRTMTFPGLMPETSSFTENHIHVWVALGSHANYPSPYSNPYCVAKHYCDKLSDGGQIWETGNNLIHLAKTNFVSFNDRWGDRKAPAGPTNEYNNRCRNAPNELPVLVDDS